MRGVVQLLRCLARMCSANNARLAMTPSTRRICLVKSRG